MILTPPSNRLTGNLFILSLYLVLITTSIALAIQVKISRGQQLPDAKLIGIGNTSVHLRSLKGHVKILSIVPQLNTPVCDEQTHRFSEDNGGLDKDLEIVTISTNTHDDQALFAEKAKIANLTFFSDAPNFDFGKKTGLLHPMRQILQRAVMVVDGDNVVRYIEIVPMSQLPNFSAALETARRILAQNQTS